MTLSIKEAAEYSSIE
ncbi:MAG: hypothetical protein ACOX66_00290 [Oscillospiraceae bacterium]